MLTATSRRGRGGALGLLGLPWLGWTLKNSSSDDVFTCSLWDPEEEGNTVIKTE